MASRILADLASEDSSRLLSSFRCVLKGDRYVGTRGSWDRGPRNTTKIKGGAEIPELAMEVLMCFLAVLLESFRNYHINGRCSGFDYGRVTHVLNAEAWRKKQAREECVWQ